MHEPVDCQIPLRLAGHRTTSRGYNARLMAIIFELREPARRSDHGCAGEPALEQFEAGDTAAAPEVRHQIRHRKGAPRATTTDHWDVVQSG